MRPYSRLLLRAAARICDQYADRALLQRSVAVPQRTWTELQRVQRLREIAGYRGWRFAVRQLDARLQRAAVDLRCEVESLLTTLHKDRSAFCPTLRDVYDELTALHDEFEHVQLDLKQGSVTVRTEPVVLEAVDLGPFDVRFEWKRLYLSPPYRVVAVDPRPARSDHDIVHPHVRSETLCEGEGKTAIRSALQQCRLCDFFLTVTHVLGTYNPSSPYVSLSHWDGASCSDCGTTLDEDGDYCCPTCHDSICWECGSRCEACEETCCQHCIATCDECDDPHCPACLKSCPDCQGDYCADCRDDNGRCAECAAPPTLKKTCNLWTPAEQPCRPRLRRLLRRPRRKRQQRKGRPLRFSPTAWAKLLFLRDIGPTEIGGFGITPADDLLYIEDVRLVRQSCTAISVAFDDVSVGEFFDEQVDQGRKPEQFARLWLHTHPGDCPWPSGVDERTFEAVFGRCDWSVMFILARGGQTYARLQFRAGPGAQLTMPVRIDWGRPFPGADEPAWEAEFMASVRPHEWGADWERRSEERPVPDDPLLGPDLFEPWDEVLTRPLHETLATDQRLETP